MHPHFVTLIHKSRSFGSSMLHLRMGHMENQINSESDYAYKVLEGMLSAMQVSAASVLDSYRSKFRLQKYVV